MRQAIAIAAAPIVAACCLGGVGTISTISGVANNGGEGETRVHVLLYKIQCASTISTYTPLQCDNSGLVHWRTAYFGVLICLLPSMYTDEFPTW